MNKLFRLYLRGFKKDSSSTAFQNKQYSFLHNKTLNNSKPIDYSKMITRASDVSFITKLYVFLTKAHFNQTLNNYFHSDRYKELQRKRESLKKILGIEDDEKLNRFIWSYESETDDDEN